MKKTSLVLALAVSISGVSPLLANEVKQQTNQNVEGITQPDQENKATQPNQDNNEPSETKQTPTASNIDWTLPGMQLSDWEYEVTDRVNVTLKKYIGKPTDTVSVPSSFSSLTGGELRPSAIFSGVALEGTAIKNLKIVNLPGDAFNEYVMFRDDMPDGYVKAHSDTWALKIPDNSVVKNIEFINGNRYTTIFNGSEARAKNNDFISIKGYDSQTIGLYGNVNRVDRHITDVETDLKYVEYIECDGVVLNGLKEKRINPNPLYLQSDAIGYYDNSMKYRRITNHYQLNQLLDEMGIKSTMQLKLDANGGNGGVVIQQPVFFVGSLTDEQQKQLYQNKQDLDACIRIAFLENPTYYPTLEGRTFLGWEKQPTNTRAVADAFNQTYLAKWSDPAPVPTVTPTPVQPNNQPTVPSTTVSTASNNQAMVLITIVLIGNIGLLSLRRWR